MTATTQSGAAPVGRPRAAPVDLRLAVPAGGAWLALALCSGYSPRCALLVAAVAFGAATVALMRARHDGRWASVALAGLCVGLVLAPFAARRWHAHTSLLARSAAQRAAVTLELTVTDDPRTLTAKGVQGTARVLVPTAAERMTIGGVRRAADGDVVVLAPATQWQQLVPGQRLRVDGALQPPLGPADPAVALSVRGPPDLLGRPPWWQRAAAAIRTDLQRACAGLPSGARGLLPGLVDGDTSGLDPVLRQRFKVAGLTHLVAVSGTNCSILVGVVLLVLRRLRVRTVWCVATGLTVLVAFVAVARPSPSVLRAALMACVGLVALAAGRPRSAVPGLAAAVLGLLLWDPQLATDAGFSMSVLATAGILLVAPGWSATLRRWRIPGGVAELVAVAAVAHLVSAPVIATIAGQVSLVAVPANVLAEPVVAAATVLGFLAAVLAPLSVALGASIAWLAGWPTRWLVVVADRLGGLQGASVPWPAGVTGGLALAVASAGGVLLCRWRPGRRAVAAATAAALVVQLPVRSAVSGWPPPGWLFAACDVGQGDALVLRAGPHSAVAVDAGPDPVAIDRCLRELGVDDLPVLVLTHFHLDHVGGIVGALRGRTLGRVLVSPLPDPSSGAAAVRAALAGRATRADTPEPGTALDAGEVHLQVLGPPQAFRGTRSDPNNSSLVIRATVHGVRILLPGDAEIEAQQALLAAGLELRADVLKVPHHGSAYSDSRFLAAVHARIAVISVGAHNDYGHPAPSLLAMLGRLGVPVRRTDRDGDVAVAGSPGRLTVATHPVGAGVS
jgi:competence protein ComEC